MNLLFQSTRRRLALWYTSVTAVLLLLFAIGVYCYVRTTLVDRIDDTLKHVVEVVDRSLVIQPLAETKGRYGVNVDASFNQNVNGLEDDHIDLEWFNPQQELLWSTFEQPIDYPFHFHRSGETVYLSRDRIVRQIVQKVELEHRVLGYLRVSHPWFEVTKPIEQLTRDLIIGISLMILSVGGIGWFLSGIAIEPIQVSYSSLKQFTADASHELRNPIATIQTNVQMALAYPEAEPQLQKRQLQIIERLTQKLGRLVNDLLFLARADSGIVQQEWQPVPLDALLIDVIEEQRIAATQKDLFLSLHIVEPELEGKDFKEEDIFTIQGDWDRLSRLFTNLIANAIEHTDNPTKSEDASVEIELEIIKSITKTIRVRETSPQYELQVTVKDNGDGIPESALPYIFDRFYRGDPSRTSQREINTPTGAGLGLAIVKAIVESHQGQISVESTLGEGTTFKILFPHSKEE
ncbi:HAMP domain-containing histidine kinase [Waterburya agarophytonicola K14]|uniref:histidine kinase n=1 Tax=Waterburya agarophytonicola KI4 TaxID=2874699 RepID=A0A964FG10_9CYAN|nr:HAMP domain-containing sensor histidine kinase [Waterburya agarophytonicola]MCC0176069.1 HAMP domain-containing histidine kinase [Waterburya agarophytonicola KI4]